MKGRSTLRRQLGYLMARSGPTVSQSIAFGRKFRGAARTELGSVGDDLVAPIDLLADLED